MNFPDWILLIPAVFLVCDAVLAIIFSERYMLWGLEYTPSIYRHIISGLSRLPHGTVLGIKLAECGAGIVIFWFALKLQ